MVYLLKFWATPPPDHHPPNNPPSRNTSINLNSLERKSI
jgi:hypothetical protein